MLTSLADRIEAVALRTAPAASARLFGALPSSYLIALQRARFRRTLVHAVERSSFYREAFRRRGIDVRKVTHPSQLGDFYTSGEDIRGTDASAFIAGRPDTAFETTGTTSAVPKRIFFSNRELESIGAASAAMLHVQGVRREDTVLSAFDCSFWVSPAVLRSALQHLRCFHVEAGKIDPMEFYEHARHYRPTVLVGEPSWMVRMSEIAAREGVWPVKLLIAGGETITHAGRQIVERAWNAPLLLNYGQTEAFGSLGMECRLQQGYHRNDLHFLFEVAEPDGDGYGELVYTTLSRDVMPLVRYRSSDVTRLMDERCGCGLFAGRIAPIRGRADEMVVCGMGNISPWVFEELLRGIPRVGGEWQVRIAHDGRVDVIELHIETHTPVSRGDLERAILDNLRDRFPDFWKNLNMNLYTLVVDMVPAGSLRDGRKLRRLVDERHAAQRQAAC
jgi:phenylacetate-CoA ligase